MAPKNVLAALKAFDTRYGSMCRGTAEYDALIEAAGIEGEDPIHHGYGCPYDGDTLTSPPLDGCLCDETGWVESAQGRKRGD